MGVKTMIPSKGNVAGQPGIASAILRHGYRFHIHTAPLGIEKGVNGRFPRCLAGKRACPPEDCGGVWGYEQFLEAIRDPNHEEHQSYLEWVGGSFDPEAFDLDNVTQQFREGVYWQGELVAPPLASTQTFTSQARWFWNSIPKEAQTRIIGAVWCSHCGQKATIINFKGNIQQGDLILRGECLRCGGVVVRLLEGSKSGLSDLTQT